MQTMLSISHLSVEFSVDSGQEKHTQLKAVRDISLQIGQGETLAVVGESGAGKSQVFHALMGLLPANGQAQGDLSFLGKPLLNQPPELLNRVRGKDIGMIFQDPMTALNPYLRIGRQLSEVLEIHKKMNKKKATQIALEMLGKVHIKDPELRFNSYPHELSGGMRQRVVIAMALLCQPRLIIADEPTTALDVTVQTEIIRLLKEVHDTLHTSIVLITHDLPLVAGLCDRIVVMYAGRIVESGSLEDVFYHAQHPYTRALLEATPQSGTNMGTRGRLKSIQGQPPDPLHLPPGCAFHPRCEHAKPQCTKVQPQLETVSAGHQHACIMQTNRQQDGSPA